MVADFNSLAMALVSSYERTRDEGIHAKAQEIAAQLKEHGVYADKDTGLTFSLDHDTNPGK